MNKTIKISALLLALSLTGCASTNPRDPFEGYNRAVFSFNDKVDEVAIKPAAETYKKVLPQFVQTGVSNFFGNLGDVWTAANNFMQGKVGNGLTDVMRVSVNSTMGFLGLLDIATEAGLPKHNEDFGQTLGRWGVKSGPYFVLPLFGPSTVRDSLAMPLDIAADPWTYTSNGTVTTAGSVVRVVDVRARLLDASTLLEEAALDRYVFVRDAYLQRRESKVWDGDPPSSARYEYDVGPTVEAEDLPAAVESGAQAVSEPAPTTVVKLEKEAAVPPVAMETKD